MTKTFKFIGMVLIAVLIGAGFAACSSGDDDEDSGNGNNYPNTEAHVIVTNDGYRYLLAHAGGNYYSYDDVNKLTKITSNGNASADFFFQYVPSFKVKASIDASYKYKKDSISMSFNAKGYITAITENYSFHESDYTDTGSRTLKFSYDGQGHLTYVSVSGKGAEVADNDVSMSWPYRYTLNSTLTLTWKNNNLVRTEYKEKQTGDDRPSSRTEIYEYTYSDELNTFNQNTCATTQPLKAATKYRVVDFYAFALIGWLGKGTEYLPRMFAYYKQEEDKEATTKSYTVSYDVSENGLISNEKYGDTGGSYSYSTAALTVDTDK